MTANNKLLCASAAERILWMWIKFSNVTNTLRPAVFWLRGNLSSVWTATASWRVASNKGHFHTSGEIFMQQRSKSYLRASNPSHTDNLLQPLSHLHMYMYAHESFMLQPPGRFFFFFKGWCQRIFQCFGKPYFLRWVRWNDECCSQSGAVDNKLFSLALRLLVWHMYNHNFHTLVIGPINGTTFIRTRCSEKRAWTFKRCVHVLHRSRRPTGTRTTDQTLLV